MIGPVTGSEKLARCVFSRKDARRVRAGKVPLRLFDKWPNGRLSVFRLSKATSDQAMSAAKMMARTRTPPTPQGWAFLTAGILEDHGLRAEASPVKDNCFHADIVLPDVARDQEKGWMPYVLDLLRYVEWEPLPTDCA